MKPGVYADIPNAAYHGGEGTSKSGLDIVRRSLLHFKCARDAANDNTPREPTPAQAFGSAFHSIVLEPHLFVRDYCLGLCRSDVPHAIDERDTLVQMVADLNATRRPKLSTSGSKAEVIERIMSFQDQFDENIRHNPFHLESLKGAELKAIIDAENATREGLLSTSGTRHDLAALLRANGHPVTLWSDVQAEWMSNNGHRQVLSEEDWTHLHGMRESVLAHPAASKLLRMPGAAERSYYAVDPKTGLLLRCRPDYDTDAGILVDLKSTDDASPLEFARSIAKWRYHVQEPFYVDVCNLAIDQAGIDMRKKRMMVFVAVEKKPPYAVGVYKLDADAKVYDDNGEIINSGLSSVEIGRLEYREDVDKLAHAIETDEWPAYGDDVQPITLPTWRKLQAVSAI